VNTRLTAAIVLLAAAPLAAQPRPKIPVSLEVRSEARPASDATAQKLLTEVRLGLEAIADVEIVESDASRRAIWIVAGTTPGNVAASLMVTERYDRETLMVLGIEDDEMAHRMMSMHIAVDHQIVTGRTTAEVAKRLVAAIDMGVLARMRSLPPRP